MHNTADDAASTAVGSCNFKPARFEFGLLLMVPLAAAGVTPNDTAFASGALGVERFRSDIRFEIKKTSRGAGAGVRETFVFIFGIIPGISQLRRPVEFSIFIPHFKPFVADFFDP